MFLIVCGLDTVTGEEKGGWNDDGDDAAPHDVPVHAPCAIVPHAMVAKSTRQHGGRDTSVLTSAQHENSGKQVPVHTAARRARK